MKEETHLSVVEQLGTDGRLRTQSWHGLRCPPLVRSVSRFAWWIAKNIREARVSCNIALHGATTVEHKITFQTHKMHTAP